MAVNRRDYNNTPRKPPKAACDALRGAPFPGRPTAKSTRSSFGPTAPTVSQAIERWNIRRDGEHFIVVRPRRDLGPFWRSAMRRAGGGGRCAEGEAVHRRSQRRERHALILHQWSPARRALRVRPVMTAIEGELRAGAAALPWATGLGNPSWKFRRETLLTRPA